jgi:hypothetical protein
LAFADPRAATVRASSLGAVIQFSGCAADDERAVVNERKLRAVGAVGRVAWVWHGLAALFGFGAVRAAQSASAFGELIGGAGIANNESRSRL